MPTTDYVAKADSTDVYKYENRVTVNNGGIVYTSVSIPPVSDQAIHASGVRLNN